MATKLGAYVIARGPIVVNNTVIDVKVLFDEPVSDVDGIFLINQNQCPGFRLGEKDVDGEMLELWTLTPPLQPSFTIGCDGRKVDKVDLHEKHSI